MIDASQAEPDGEAAAAAIAVLDRFLAALNAGDTAALLATMHFPHYRLAGVTMRVWNEPDDSYLSGFYARAGEGWHHTEWDFRRVIAAGPEKVGKNFYERSLKQRDQGGAPLEKGAALATFLASSQSDGITGKLLSAVWDDWQNLPAKRDQPGKSDVYTLRRITPEDRGWK